jgi:hypothetical protein
MLMNPVFSVLSVFKFDTNLHKIKKKSYLCDNNHSIYIKHDSNFVSDVGVSSE